LARGDDVLLARGDDVLLARGDDVLLARGDDVLLARIDVVLAFVVVLVEPDDPATSPAPPLGEEAVEL
jgi:hypothetical protein